MNWEVIGILAEVVGAIAVVVTLLFLAIQIQQHSKSVKTAAAQSVIQSLADSYNTTSMSPHLCHIIVVGAKDIENLSDTDTAQLYMWLTSWFRLVEQAYFHYTLGNLRASTWNGQLAHLKSALSTEAMAEFWAVRKEIYSMEFRTFVDQLDTSDAATIDQMFAGFNEGK
jgi:hypothetical protein